MNFQLAFIITIILLIISFLIIIYLLRKRIIYFFKLSINKIIKPEINKKNNIIEIAKALEILKKNNKGATIIIRKFDSIDEYISDPIELNAIISSELIVNIFEGTKSPLHDGAIIIEKGLIKYASAYINFLSSSSDLSKTLGTRHRSAIGLSEKSDCVSIVLSEESGTIIIASKGKYSKIQLKDLESELAKAINGA